METGGDLRQLVPGYVRRGRGYRHASLVIRRDSRILALLAPHLSPVIPWDSEEMSRESQEPTCWCMFEFLTWP